MAKATLFVLIAVAAGLAVYLIAAPHFSHQSEGNPQVPRNSTERTAPTSDNSSPQTGSAGVSPSDSSSGVDSEPPIAPPQTNEQREHTALEVRRGPLYDWIRNNMQHYLVGWQPATEDPATLNLYLARSSTPDVTQCMEKVVTPYATRYGFNHVKFYVPMPASEIDHWHLDSEATPDDKGAWNEYRK